MTMDTLRSIHRWTGLVVVLAFVATGIFMRAGFPGIDDPDHLVRSYFRANHVYLLASGLLNIAVGAYLVLHDTRWRRNLQLAGSALLLLAPVVLLTAYMLEPVRATPHRPLTSVGVLLLFLAVMLHVPGRIRKKI